MAERKRKLGSSRCTEVEINDRPAEKKTHCEASLHYCNETESCRKTNVSRRRISSLPVNIPTRIWWSWFVKIIPSDAMFPSVLRLAEKSAEHRAPRAACTGNDAHPGLRRRTTSDSSDGDKIYPNITHMHLP